MRRQPCKLMRDDNTTGIANRLHWGEGVNNRIFKYGYELRTNQVIHFYDHPLQATFFSPIHVTDYTKLREVTHYSKMVSDGTKCAAKSVTTGKEIPIPEITIEQRVEIAIRCVLRVCEKPKFVKWAEKWLSGEDRSLGTAYTAYAAAYYATCAAHCDFHIATYDVARIAALAVSRTDLPADQILQIIGDVVGWGE